MTTLNMNNLTNIFKFSNKFLQMQKRCLKMRKYPIDRDQEKELPTFVYPTAESDDRRVYVFGYAETGALGLQLAEVSKRAIEKNDMMKKEKRIPKRLGFAERNKITDTTCGYGFTLFSVKSSDNVKVYGTGINSDSQIGYQAPRRLNPLEVVLAPAPINLPLKEPKTTKVISIAAGRAHSIIVTDKEGVFTLGNNAYGQCGRRVIGKEDYKNSMILHRIASVDNENIVKAECGQDHSMFLTESGKVFACGWGADGQLGRGNFDSDFKLIQAKGDIEGEKIVKLSCTADCILALNDKGEVFGWGNSEYGQLNYELQSNQQVNVPRALRSSNKLGKIIDIAAGGSFCMILTEFGEVYTWGYGILGVGPAVEHSPVPIKIPTALFGRNEFQPNSVVTKIFCGITHLSAITDTGDLYTWGKNKSGCLGLGNDKDQFFPLKAAIGARAIKVGCGVDHTVVLCKAFV